MARPVNSRRSASGSISAALSADVIDAFAFLGGKSVTYRNDVPAGTVAEADREQVTRILTNLVRNAVQALEQGDWSRHCDDCR